MLVRTNGTKKPKKREREREDTRRSEREREFIFGSTHRNGGLELEELPRII
jgi:hypothetical protein